MPSSPSVPEPPIRASDPAALPHLPGATFSDPEHAERPDHATPHEGEGSMPVYAPGDIRRPVAWSVPLGVRTASEWAWRIIVIAVAILGGLWLLGHFSEITIPVAVALLLAALLHPVTEWLDRRLPTSAAAGITVLGTLTATIGLLSFVGSQFTSQFGDIRDQVGEGIDQIRAWLRDTMHISDTQVDDWINKARESFTAGNSNLGETAAQAGLTATHAIAGFFIAMFTLFFFLYEGPRIWAWAVALFPRGARARVHSSGIIAWGQLSAFTRATVIVAAVDALGIGIGAAILGVPFASGIGILVFFGAFIPVIGAAISGAVAVLLALVALGPIKALIMLGIVIAVQQVESHVMQPFLLGRAVRVHPLSVILAIAAGVVVAGIAGALIAVPTVAVLNAVGHHLLDEEEPVETAADVLTPAQRSEAASEVAEEEAHLTAEQQD
jgi:predicted PurR-regulated permease PerM